jgi:hypothetical protein
MVAWWWATMFRVVYAAVARVRFLRGYGCGWFETYHGSPCFEAPTVFVASPSIAKVFFCLRAIVWRLPLCFLLCSGWFFVVGFAFSLASAISRWRAGVAPVRGGTYFSLQRQRKVGKRKPLTPLTLVQTSKQQRP